MAQKINKFQFFALAGATSLGLIINALTLQSAVIGVIFAAGYIVFCGYIFGSIFFTRLNWQLLFGSLLFFAAIAVLGAAGIFTIGFGEYQIYLSVLLLPALLLLPYYQWAAVEKTTFWQLAKNYWEKFWERKEPKINLLLSGFYLLLAAGCFFLLFHGQTRESIQSPWQVVRYDYFFPGYFAATAVLLFYCLLARRTKLPLILVFIHALLSSSVAMIVYQVGYGYDPFIHQATERIIARTGTITPTPLYYLGQYAIVVFLQRLTMVDLKIIDTLLVPVFFALYLPATIFYVFSHWLRKNFALALALSILAIPYAKFIMTAPQNLANLFFLLTILFSLLYYRNEVSLLLLAILAAATVATHLLAGIPLLITLFLLVLYKFMFHSYARCFSLYLLPAAVFVIFLPLAFIANGSQIIAAWPDFKLADFIWLRWVDKFDLPLNLGYLFFGNQAAIAAAVIAVGIIYLAKHRLLKNNASYLIASGIILTDFFICKYFLTFPALRDYDKDDFIARLALMAFYVLLPFFLIGLYYFMKKLWLSDVFSKSFLVLALAGIITASLYFSYPTLDQYQPSKFFSVSAADLQAVDYIEQNAGPDYIVLANQMVGAAAIGQYGFKNYYQGQFYYSLPSGADQSLYEKYLEMVYQGAKKETMAQAMATAGVKEAYFVIDSYWRDADKIAKAAARSADGVYNVNGGKVYIFKYLAD